MKRYLLPVALVAFGLAAVGAQASQDGGIPFEKLNGQVRIIGHFGEPLGTKLKITGSVPEHLGKTSETFQVRAVDGKALKKPVFIQVQGEEIKPGVEYTLEGYETGAFSINDEWGPGGKAPVEFRFWIWFLVVKTTSEFLPQ